MCMCVYVCVRKRERGRKIFILTRVFINYIIRLICLKVSVLRGIEKFIYVPETNFYMASFILLKFIDCWSETVLKSSLQFLPLQNKCNKISLIGL
jgi:hypothetical protein